MVLFLPRTILTATQFTLLSNVVDRDNHGTTGPRKIFGHNTKRRLNIQTATTGKLWNLGISAGTQNVSHLQQDFLHGQVVFRRLVIGIQNLQHG